MPTPFNQLLSRTLYITDGSTTEWDFSFSGGYILKSHIKAYIEAPSGARYDLVVTEDMITGPFTLRVAPALVAGNILAIYRDTPKDLPLVDFTDESGFSEVSLDTNAKQAVFIAAEAVDEIRLGSDYEAAQSAEAAATSADLAAASALATSLAAEAAAASASEAIENAANALASADNAALAATTVFNSHTTPFSRTLLGAATAEEATSTLGAAASGANTDITSIAGNAATATTAAAAPWSGVTGKPTTVAGYGITDMGSQSVNYANTSGNADTATKLSNDTGSAPSYSCRAWVNFNGTGAVFIRASGNVSSITDNGTGDYTVNFTTAMPDANFSAACSAVHSANTNIAMRPSPFGNYGSSSFRVRTADAGNNSAVDADTCFVAIFR